MPQARFPIVVASLLYALAAPARAQPSLNGQRDVFPIGDCSAAITLRFVSDKKPVAVRTGDLAPRPAATPPAWTIEWDTPAPSDASINEYVSTGHLKDGCPAPGLYGVPLTVFAEDKSTAPLAVSLIRVAEPALDIPTTVTLPAESLGGLPSPVTVLVRETAAGSPDVRLTVAGGELKTAGGDATGIMLEPASTPVVVKSGESARIALTPSAVPAPGTYATKIVLTSPALKSPAAIDVTYRFRLSSLYLLVIMLAGIALGWFVNVYLAARAAFSTAMQAGLRNLQSITRRATPQRDAAVQQRLLAVATMLQSGLEEASTPDDVAARVDEADAQAKDIETKAADAAAALLQGLAATRGLFRPAGVALDDMLSSRLAAPLADLDALQRAADAGDVEQTTARLQDYGRDLPPLVAPIVQSLLADIRTDLDALGPLSDDGTLRGRREALRQSIEAVYQEQDLGKLLKAANDVAVQLRTWMDLVAPAALATLWREAARIVAAEKPALAQRLGFAADQADQLRRTGRDPLARLGALGDLAKTVASALTEAGADASSVSGGDVLAVARRLAGTTLLARQEPRALVATTPSSGALVLAPAGPIAILRVKPLVGLGQDSMVLVRWLGPLPLGRIAWRCDPADAGTVQSVATGAVLRASRAGFVTVVLELDGARIAEARTFAGEATEETLAVVSARKGAVARAVTTAVTALLTAFAGYVIFVPTWYGTIGDFSAVFLWGFFGQFGLDRIRELARPLTSKPLPTA